jgi:hypothetical protein
MESLNMTSINVISSRNAISWCQEDSTQFTAQQSLFPTYHPDGPSVFEEVSKTPQQTPTTGNSCSHRCLDSLEDSNSREHLFAQVSEWQTEGCEHCKQPSGR